MPVVVGRSPNGAIGRVVRQGAVVGEVAETKPSTLAREPADPGEDAAGSAKLGVVEHEDEVLARSVGAEEPGGQPGRGLGSLRTRSER
jgi:hypothetical protein